MSSRIALFGGTFDPVHFGHLRAALEARELLGLETLSLLPAGDPPHRKGTHATAAQRLDMLRLATREVDGFSIDERELNRPGASYMVDTLRSFREQAGDTPVLLLIGQDAANSLDQWHQWQDIPRLAHLVVMRRPGSSSHLALAELRRRLAGQVADLDGSPAGLVLPLEITQLDISSTYIRSELSAGRSARYLLPESVLEYVHQRGLYQPR